MGNEIWHRGRIVSIDNDAREIGVLIEQRSACADCHARGVCSAADSAHKVIEVALDGVRRSVGEEVMLVGASSVGVLALWYAFVLPFVLLLLVFAAMILSSQTELASGLAALGSLFPYYMLLSLFKKRLKKKLTFTISDI